MESKLKNKNEAVVRASKTLQIMSHICLGSVLAIALPVGCMATIKNQQLDNECDKIRQSQAYEDYLEYKKDMYDRMVDDGVITREEGDQNLNLIKSNDHIIDNIEIIDDRCAESIKDLQTKEETYKGASFGVATTNMALGLALGIPGHIMGIFQKFRKEEREL